MTSAHARIVAPEMPPEDAHLDWADRLPPVRGRFNRKVQLADVTWFRVGGPADVVFRPADANDLASFLGALDPAVPVTVLGVGSNLLIRDGGVSGVVVRLGRPFAQVAADGDTVRAGGGALDLNVALTARDAGLAGLEFLSGIPGTVGGALRSNAGAYGGEIVDVLTSAVAIDRAGRRHEISAADLGLTYRHCAAPEDWIFVEATFHAATGDKASISARIAEIDAARRSSQPVRARTGGSTFVNPPGHKAWALIDAAGCRGLRKGAAQVSPQHANFLLNNGDATAADLEQLGEEVRRRVFETSGIRLAWEIKRVGCHTRTGPEGSAR